jgi:CheY-like chemotaxis protein
VANVPVPLPGESVESPLTVPSGVRILVVDDDPRVCRSIANAMARLGFHALSAEDGAPALEIAARTPPDIALVDFNMPTPGLTVIERLKAARGPAIHITVLSGQDDEETRAACFTAGADDVLSKPANIAELRRRMVTAARIQEAHVAARLARERTDRLLAYGAEAAMLAHELGPGLAGALANLSQLGAAELGEREAEALAEATSALRRMSRLAANLVDIARFDDASVKPQTSSTKVRALLQAVTEIHATLPASDTRLEIDCDPELTGIFDPALIERVLHHLIGGAIRRGGPPGLIRLSARTGSPLSPSGVELTVFHSGPPAPDPLHFCRLACEAHGGTLAHGVLDDGTAFWIRLPGRT